jgi:L-arabinose isomerase
MRSERPTVGLVSVYFTFFDAQMPDLRASREAAARLYADVLGRHFDVVYPGLVTSDDDGRRVNAALRAERLDAVVFAPSMAAPPSHGQAALAGLDVPLVVWNAPLVERLADDLTQAEATVNSTQVGAVMLANVLVRAGRRFATVTASPASSDDVDRVVRTIRAASAASALRGRTALRLGEPIAGYTDVEATADELAQVGVTERAVAVEELDEAFAAVGDGAVSALLADLDRRFVRTPSARDADSAQLALALRGLFEAYGADFGTVNCHGSHFRRNARVGITACLGVSLLAERGVSVSCTGDQPTALALALGRALSGRALYCEFYTAERQTGLMLLAAGGEGDPAWASPGEPVRIEPNTHYPGVRGSGAALGYRLEQGPATVLSLSPAARGWRLAWATGEVVETRYPRMGGPNAMFRFDSGPAYEAGARWIESGATHHNALARGRLDLEVPVLAQALGVEAVRV